MAVVTEFETADEAQDLEEPAPLLLESPGAASGKVRVQPGGCRALASVVAVAALVTAVALLLSHGAAPGPAGAPVATSVVEPARLFEAQSCTGPQDGMNNGGTNLVSTAAVVGSAEDCCSSCLRERACKGYTWVKGSSECWLKSSLGTSESDDSVISGSVTFAIAAPSPSAPPASARAPAPATGQVDTGPLLTSPGAVSAISTITTDSAFGQARARAQSPAAAGHSAGARKPLAPLAPPSSKQDPGWSEAHRKCEGHANLAEEKSARLLGKTLRMRVDVSQIGCGCVTGVYLVEWGDGGNCDASGSFDGRCGEIDIMEANKYAWHTTLHNPQDHPGLAGGFGGVQQFDMMYGQGPRDMSGDQYGPDGSVIDTNEAFYVAVSFPQRPDGSLADMVVMMYQEGKEHAIEWRVNRPRADETRSPPMTCEDAGCENCFSKPGCVYKGEDLKAFGSWLDKGMTPLSTYWGGSGNTFIDGVMDDEAGGCKLGPKGTPGTEEYGDYQAGGGCGDQWFSVGEFSLEDIQDPGIDWDEFFTLMDGRPLIQQS